MLFGHQDNSNQQSAAAPVDVPDQSVGVNPLAVDPATGSSLPVVPTNSLGPVDTPEEPSILDQGPVVSSDSTVVPDPSSPFSPDPTPIVAPDPGDTSSLVTPDASAASSFGSTPSDATASTFATGSIVTAAADPSFEIPGTSLPSVDASTTTVTNDPHPDTDTLFSLKQQVVTQLSPLVAHLEQSPEEKFKTTMMLIQSTDNSTLLQDAYNLAQQIPDEKSRAQALLDVVNEINYFTQQQQTDQ